MSPDFLQIATDHLQRGRLAEAEQVLTDILARHPDQPDARALLGLVYLFTYREPESLACLRRGARSEFAHQLVALLAEHLACRRKMARRTGAPDSDGEAMIREFEAMGHTLDPLADITLSACLIVRNEEKFLDNCLSSLRDIVDEIVVADTGSTDRSRDIARRYGANVLEVAWSDDFAAARNASLEAASGAWVLWIDADEELTRESHAAIREALIRPQFGGYYVEIVNYLADEGTASTYVHAPIRLFRRTAGVRFEGRIHEQIAPSITATGRPCAHLKDACILHYGYRPLEMAERGKIERTIRLLRREVEENPNNAFQWFNLANAYSVAGDYPNTEHAARESIRSLPEAAAFTAGVHHLLCTSLVEQNRPYEAILVCDDVDRLGHSSIINEFNRAHALLRAGKPEEALVSTERVFGMEWAPQLMGDYGIVTHKKWVLKGQVLYELGRYDEALACLDTALGIDPTFQVTRFSRAATLERMDRHAEAMEAFDSGIDGGPLDLASRRGAMRTRVRQGLFEETIELGRTTWQRYQDLESWLLWLTAIEQRQDAAAMVEAYDAYHQAHPLTPDMLINMGRALGEVGQIERALDVLSEAIRQAPHDPNACFNAADLFYRIEMFADAARLYQAGLHIDPRHTEAWFCLGNALASLGIAAGARIAYEKVLELEPGHADALHNLRVVDEAELDRAA